MCGHLVRWTNRGISIDELLFYLNMNVNICIDICIWKMLITANKVQGSRQRTTSGDVYWNVQCTCTLHNNQSNLFRKNLKNERYPAIEYVQYLCTMSICDYFPLNKLYISLSVTSFESGLRRRKKSRIWIQFCSSGQDLLI